VQGHFDVSINGVSVASFDDSTYSPGGIGLEAGPAMECVFTDLVTRLAYLLLRAQPKAPSPRQEEGAPPAGDPARAYQRIRLSAPACGLGMHAAWPEVTTSSPRCRPLRARMTGPSLPHHQQRGGAFHGTPVRWGKARASCGRGAMRVRGGAFRSPSPGAACASARAGQALQALPWPAGVSGG
jgi:hypothetical protein